MCKAERGDAEALRRKWDRHAERYDAYQETFQGAVEHYVDWELLKFHLPQNRDARILDAAGGTGRITLPLTKMGYSVTLCDISPGMLAVARRKLLKEGVLDRVEIVECDVRELPFGDGNFDFVLSWDGGSDAVSEVVRVTKKGGGISLFLLNRYRAGIDLFRVDPESALALVESRSDHVCDEGVIYSALSPEEVKKSFEASGVRVLNLYAAYGWMDLLGISQQLCTSTKWDEAFFRQVTQMLLRLSREPSVLGMSKHLVLYGKKN